MVIIIKKILIFAIVIAFVVMSISLIESFNHNYNDEPKESDVIIMLGGDSGRMEKAAELYHAGFSQYIIITPVIESMYANSKEFAIDLGVSPEAIIEEEKATSTYSNAIEALKIMEEREFESALIVTNDYHIKRSKMIFHRVDKNDFDLRYIAAQSVNGEEWYEKPNANKVWFREFYKLWGYRLGLYKFFDETDENLRI